MKMNKTKILLSTLAGFCLMAAAGPAYAQFHEGDKVTMGGEPVFTILAGAEGFSPTHRAWITQDKLDNALVLANDRSPAAVCVARVNGAEVVQLGGRTIATADDQSAALEKLTVDQLANKWADSIKNFLSDSGKTANYVAVLTGQNQIKAPMAIAERRLYAPAGLEFSVKLDKDLVYTTAKAGDIVEGTIVSNVPVGVGHYFIPANSKVIGEVVASSVPGEYTISFNKLCTSDGQELPIKAIVATTYIASQGPHSVCTYVLPSGMANGMPDIVGRVPASIGIGTRSGPGTELYVLRQGDMMAASTPVMVLLESSASVAVVSSQTMM